MILVFNFVCEMNFEQYVKKRQSEEYLKFLRAHLDKKLDWPTISKHPNVTLDVVLSNPDLEWSLPGLSMNPNITIDIVKAYPDKDWSYQILSLNPNIKLDFVLQNMDKDWNWD